MPATGPSRPLPITDPRRLRAALEGYGARDRRVLELRYGLSGERQHSLSEIGRILGLSGERVRQLEARALDRLSRQESGLPLPQVARRPPTPRRVVPGGTASSRRRFLRPWTLALIRMESMHGARLKERFRELGMPEVDYRFLRGLEEDGLLHSTWVPGSGVGPDRRVYSLTEKGREELERSLPALQGVADLLERLLRSSRSTGDRTSMAQGGQLQPASEHASNGGDVREGPFAGITPSESSNPEERGPHDTP